MEFTYTLTRAGWARATIRIGESAAEASASYLSDALRDFLIMLAVVAKGWADQASCCWQEEPGEFRWFLTRLDDRRVELVLRSWVGDDPEVGTRRLRVECPFGDLRGAVLAGVSDMLEAVGGPDAYAERWALRDHSPHSGDFPMAVFKDLANVENRQPSEGE